MLLATMLNFFTVIYLANSCPRLFSSNHDEEYWAKRQRRQSQWSPNDHWKCPQLFTSREVTPKHFLKQQHLLFPFHKALTHFLSKFISNSPFPSIPSLLGTQPFPRAQLHSGTLITVALLIRKSISPLQCSVFKAVHPGRVLRVLIALLIWIYL